MGSRFLYALVLAATGLPAPDRPFILGDPARRGPDTAVATDTLHALRLAAIACVATGFGLLALRLRWRGVVAAALVLAIPHAREDLARAWAEGPLVLGFGLCAVAFGTRRFALACGVAASFKLTALAAWPLLLWPRASGRSRAAGLLAVPVAVAVWTLLTPPAWFLLGPPYLVAMVLNRQAEHAGQSVHLGGDLGLFLPSRYLLPLELGAALGLAWLAGRAWARLRP
jgi:hypothetical protein